MPREMRRVTVDTTVQDKAVAFPTDRVTSLAPANRHSRYAVASYPYTGAAAHRYTMLATRGH